jgi:xanthine dehydrogenase YagS FAD-binding subunit
MNPFSFMRAAEADEAIHAGSAPGAKFLGGGTNLIDLMKDGVEAPTTLVDIHRLDLVQIEKTSGGGVLIGSIVRNGDLANHPFIRKDYPLLSAALLSGASPQLRNMATTGGNLMQRTRCYYFMDTAFAECNKRAPGSGCAAIRGYNRIHAILGASDQCIATNPSDMNVALAALDATIHVKGARGERSIAIADFHRLPGNTPQTDTNLQAGELITGIELPAPRYAAHSHYLKVRDRNSYAFALVSVAPALDIEGTVVRSAAIALGGVAHKPWRSAKADAVLVGRRPDRERFEQAAELLLAGATPYQHNAFKIPLAKRSIVRALTVAVEGARA